MTSDRPRTDSRISRRARLGAGLLAAIALTALLLAGGGRAAGLLPAFADRVDGLGVWGPVAFVGGYALATVAFVPGSLLTLAAGALFGVGRGTLLVLVAATLGASLAFLLARTFARGAIERRLAASPRFAAVDRAVGRDGLRTVFLLRLSPIFPFSLLNYALGLTAVRFRDFLLASVGMLPGTLLYVSLGRGIGDLAALAAGRRPEAGGAGLVLLGVGIVATLLVTVLVTRAAKRALAEATAESVEPKAAPEVVR